MLPLLSITHGKKENIARALAISTNSKSPLIGELNTARPTTDISVIIALSSRMLPPLIANNEVVVDKILLIVINLLRGAYKEGLVEEGL